MQSFAAYAIDRWAEDSLDEAFSREEIIAFQPENGMWVPPLEHAAQEHVFHYSVSSDPHKWCNSRYSGIPCNEVGPEEREMNGCLPCYEVHIGGGYISFKHKHTGYSDRFAQNTSTASRTGVGAMDIATEQMYSVLHAVGQYIQRWHPDRLNWSAVSKTREGARNREARGKVYFLWMAKNLYPEYVPIRDTEWMLVWLYKTLYPAQDGYPDPDKIPEIGGAKKFLQAHESANETASHNREQRLDRERRDRMATLLNDPNANPNRIQLHDIVMVKGPSAGSPHPSAGSTEGMLYTVFGVDVDTYGDYGEQGGLYVDLDPYRQAGDDYPHNRFSGPVALSIKQVVKADESLLTQRRNTIRTMQQQHNPHGLQPGDLVVVADDPFTAGGVSLGRVEFIRMRGGEPTAMLRMSRTSYTQWEPLTNVRPARGEEIDELS